MEKGSFIQWIKGIRYKRNEAVGKEWRQRWTALSWILRIHFLWYFQYTASRKKEEDGKPVVKIILWPLFRRELGPQTFSSHKSVKKTCEWGNYIGKIRHDTTRGQINRPRNGTQTSGSKSEMLTMSTSFFSSSMSLSFFFPFPFFLPLCSEVAASSYCSRPSCIHEIVTQLTTI